MDSSYNKKGKDHVYSYYVDGIKYQLKSTAYNPQRDKVFILLALVFAVISVLAYLIVAANYGWKYMVLFEMNEDEVRHIQMESQFKKAQALGWLTAMAAGSYSVMGAGLLAAARDRSVSVFGSVTSFCAAPKGGSTKYNDNSAAFRYFATASSLIG